MISEQPRVLLSDRQRKVRIKLAPLREFAERAFRECLRLPRQKDAVLALLSELSVVVMSDKRIGAIHESFMQDPTPTDVITFQHGEIVISVDTAKRNARTYQTSLDHELKLYFVHGLLHLGGYDDKTKKGAAEMKRLQEAIVAKLDER